MNNTFGNHGFLSSHELDVWAENIRENHADWFCLIGDLNEEAMRICSALQPSKGNNQHLLAATIFYRALQSFQGAVLLAERGMPADALTLVRNCAESSIALGGVAHDASFVQLLISGHNKHRKKVTYKFLNTSSLANELTDAQKMQGKVLLSELSDSDTRGFTWDALAHKIGMDDLYNTVYRSISGNAAHVTISALDRHFCFNSKGEFEKLMFQPDKRDIVLTLSMAVCSLLNAMEQLNQIFSDSTAVKSYMGRWKVLAIPLNQENENAQEDAI